MGNEELLVVADKRIKIQITLFWSQFLILLALGPILANSVNSEYSYYFYLSSSLALFSFFHLPIIIKSTSNEGDALIINYKNAFNKNRVTKINLKRLKKLKTVRSIPLIIKPKIKIAEFNRKELEFILPTRKDELKLLEAKITDLIINYPHLKINVSSFMNVISRNE